MPQNTTTQSRSDADGAVALSAVWAGTMLLGLAIHSAVTYGVVDYRPVWNLKDEQTHPIFDWVVRFIHCFRMPLFFMVSGYLTAHLFKNGGVSAILRSVLRHLLLPFVGGVLVLWPLSYAAFTYSSASVQHPPSALHEAAETITFLHFLPFKTGHVWFLYFLVLQTSMVCALALLCRKAWALHAFLHQASVVLFERFWPRFFLLAGALFLCLCWMGKPFILTNHRWSINPAIFTTYIVYFGAGWMLCTSGCVMRLKQHGILQVIGGLVLFVLHGWLSWPSEPWTLPVQQALVATYSTLFMLGFTSLALSHCSRPSPLLAYSIESAYWVYWVHLPVVAFLPGFWSNWPVSAGVKFLLTLISTASLCLLIYGFLVRNTRIGKLMNGLPFEVKELE